MLVNTLLKAVAASLTLSSAPALAAQDIDQAKVQKYKALFAEQQDYGHVPSGTTTDTPTKTFDLAVFGSPFKWADVVYGAWPLSRCPASCQACPAGCNPACCVRRPKPWPPESPGNSSSSSSSSGNPSTSPTSTPTPTPSPKSPLTCPCRCGSDCPPAVQAVCCSTPGSNDDDNDDDDSDPPEPHKFGPLICPCHCEASCPAWIQAICCDTPGSGTAAPSDAGDAGSDSQLGLVMQNAAGEPVAVLATTNLTVEQSFVTTDLVRGLGRIGELKYDDHSGGFQIVLDVIVGSEKDAGEKDGAGAGGGGGGGGVTALEQSFQVIDGSRLVEQEQILLGLKFMARIDDGLNVNKAYLTGLQEGLRIETGERPSRQKPTPKKSNGRDEL